MARAQQLRLWDPALVGGAALEAARKLDPRVMVRNPVMFVVEAGATLTTRMPSLAYCTAAAFDIMRTAPFAAL